MTMVTSTDIARVVKEHLSTVASKLRPDVLAALVAACTKETCPQARKTLELLIENAHLAASTATPLCQDTGTVWILIELGSQANVELIGLQDVLDELVEDSFKEQHLRASTVSDALSKRINPGTNAPAFVEIVQHSSVYDDSDFEVKIHTMLKGAGSDNSSHVAMLSPSEGEEGIVQLVLDTVADKASIACPPMIIGIGIGSTFDKVAGLSKHALLRPLNQPANNNNTAQLEQRILTAVNATGKGPAGLGGNTTALAVHIETAPSHIASLPTAINLCCHSLRSRSTTLGL